MKIKLNLVPYYRKEKILEAGRLRTILRWSAALTAILMLFFILLLSLNYILKINLAAVSNSQSDLKNVIQYKKIEKYDEETKKINSQISSIDKIQKNQLYWSKLLWQLSDIVFSGIKIDSLTTKNFQVFLQGKADRRDDLILLKEKLEKEKCFSNVNLPLSNLTERENAIFQIDFKIKEECVKIN